MDYYQTLGVNKTASDAELKAAYRKKALEWHPDRNKSAGATEKFKEINEAYEILSNPQKRQTYDQFGPSAFSQGYGGPGGAQGNPFNGGPFTYTYRSSGGQNPFEGMDFGGFSDPFEIFEQFFGASYGGVRGGANQRRQHFAIKISFMEAIKGTEKVVNIGNKTRTIKIPPGVDTGSRVRFPEFDLTIEVEKDKVFQREGDDLYVEVPVVYPTLVLGGEIEVPTLEGKIKVRIPEGTSADGMIRLRGQGVPHVNGRGAGSLMIKIKVAIPNKLTGDQKRLLEQLQKTMDTKRSGWF